MEQIDNAPVMRDIFECIAAADTIIISRHRRPDGDAVGSTLGLAALLRASFPEKRVFLDNDDRAEYLAFLGDEGPRPEAADYANAAVIVLDTGTADRIANERVFTGRTVIKIDHHICDDHYGGLVWVEEERSSVCEMIAAFYCAFADRLVLTKTAAECLYTGMVTDSGRFRFRGTNGDTLRLAAMLLDAGVDFERIFSQLSGEDLETVRFEGYLASRIRTTPAGVAYLRISRRLRLRHGISLEDACNTVSLRTTTAACACGCGPDSWKCSSWHPVSAAAGMPVPAGPRSIRARKKRSCWPKRTNCWKILKRRMRN